MQLLGQRVIDGQTAERPKREGDSWRNKCSEKLSLKQRNIEDHVHTLDWMHAQRALWKTNPSPLTPSPLGFMKVRTLREKTQRISLYLMSPYVHSLYHNHCSPYWHIIITQNINKCTLLWWLGSWHPCTSLGEVFFFCFLQPFYIRFILVLWELKTKSQWFTSFTLYSNILFLVKGLMLAICFA